MDSFRFVKNLSIREAIDRGRTLVHRNEQVAVLLGVEYRREGSLRGDTVIPSLDRRAVMPQAPDTDQVFFKVPKVIER